MNVVKDEGELNAVDELPDVNLFDSVSLPLTGLVMQMVTFLQDLYKQVFNLSLATGSVSSRMTTKNKNMESSLSSLGIQLNLCQDTLRSDPGVTNYPLRSTWEGNEFLKETIDEGSSHVVPSVMLPQVNVLIGNDTQSLTGKAIELKKEVAALESVMDNELGPLQTLYSVCSGSDNKPTAEALSKNLVNLFDRLAAVKHHCVAIATQPSSSLGSRPAPPLSSSRDTELDACKAQLSLFAF